LNMTANKKIILLLTAAFSALQAFPQWTANPAVNTPVCTTANTHQMFPQAASDENGGVFVTWIETSADMTSTRVFAQHLSPAGTKLWAEGGIEVTNGGAVYNEAQIISDATGGAIISWANINAGIVKHYMQRVSSTGQIQWAAGGILVCNSAVPFLVTHKLVADGEGGATLLWDDTRENGRVRAQHLDKDGNLLWPADGLPVSPEFTSMPNFFDAVADNDGGIILCYMRNSGLLNHHEVYVQHINAEGIAEWGSLGKNLSNVPGDQLFCRLAKDTNDHVIVIWQDFRLDPVWSQMYGQRIDSVGNEQWGQNGKLLADSLVPDYTWFRVVTDTKKGVVITWFDNFTPQSDTAHLYGMRIDSTGSKIWTKNELVTWFSGQVPNDYKIVPDFKGGCYINFSTPGPDPNLDPSDLGAQHVFPDGSLEFPLTGMAVSTAPQMQAWQQLMCDSNGLAVVVWTDLRSMTNYDVYAMRIGMPAALPVTWLNFSGKLQGSSVLLTWQTADEVNNKGFTIQRSGNGNLFYSIGFKPAGAQYSFTDLNPLPGHNYYRLQQTDIDGKTTYSRVIKVDAEMTTRLRLYPNPARGKIIVNGIRPGSRLLIYDAVGRLRKQVMAGNGVQEIHITDLTRGIYYLVEENDKSQKIPFFVF
jgi:hypothetical protein